MDNSEKSNKREGLIGSLIFHSVLFAIFFFFVLKTPDPPLNTGGSGIELNYGTYEEGSGDLQTLNEAGPEIAPDVPQPAPEPVPIPPEPLPEPVPPVEDQPDEQETALTDNPEDVAIETKKKESPKVEKKEIPKPVKPTPVKEEKKVPKETKPEVPKIIPPKHVPAKTPVTEKTNAEINKGGNNNGDREGKVGDQGNPQGNVNAKALYGNLGEGGEGSGGSGGSKLDLTGWKLDFRLDKKDVTNENGKIVYQIKVDDKGELVSIIPLEKTVSPAVEKFYRQQIEDNWAVDRTKDNTNPPPIATGRYTVFVRSK